VGAYVKWQLSRNAKAQGAEARGVIYGPVTVASIVKRVERKAAWCGPFC
jgi:hypothetical protein